MRNPRQADGKQWYKPRMLRTVVPHVRYRGGQDWQGQHAQTSVINAFQGAAAEDLGLSRADDASESGVGSMKSGGFTQVGERSEAGTMAGDRAYDDAAVATSDLVRQKDLVYRPSMPPGNL